MCGGLTKNSQFVKMAADILELPVIIPTETESVLIGSAMLGVCAARGSSLDSVLTDIKCDGRVVLPDLNDQTYHRRKYQVFLKMAAEQTEARRIMNE